VDPNSGAKNASAVKRQKAAAMSAKAAAAAAKEGINVQMKVLQAGGSGVGLPGKPLVTPTPLGFVAGQHQRHRSNGRVGGNPLKALKINVSNDILPF